MNATATPREIRKADLLTLAGELAPELEAATGDTWTPEPHPSADVAMVRLVRAADGARLEVRMSTYYAERGRLIVAGDEPAEVDHHNRTTPGQTATHVSRDLRATFTPGRPARAIARDVARRVVPGLAAETERVRAAVAKAQQYTDATETNARQLAAAIGGRVDVERHSGKVTGRVFLPGHGADVEVSGDRVRFDRMSSVTVDQAARIAAILAERD